MFRMKGEAVWRKWIRLDRFTRILKSKKSSGRRLGAVTTVMTIWALQDIIYRVRHTSPSSLWRRGTSSRIVLCPVTHLIKVFPSSTSSCRSNSIHRWIMPDPFLISTRKIVRGKNKVGTPILWLPGKISKYMRIVVTMLNKKTLS